MTILGPESSKAIAPGVRWWICICGRAIYVHSQRTIPSTGGREYVCGITGSGRFEPASGDLDFSYDGLVAK